MFGKGLRNFQKVFSGNAPKNPSTSTSCLIKSSNRNVNVRGCSWVIPNEKLGILEEPGKTQKTLIDKHCGHRTFLALDYEKFAPKISHRAFVAPDATIVGNVILFDKASIWYNVVITAETNSIRVGGYTNIQDGTVIHEALAPLDANHDGSTIVGHFVTVGHNCTLSACTIEDFCLVGMGSTLQEGSYMETYSMLGAGSVLPRGARMRSGEIWVGKPAKFQRKLTYDEYELFKTSAEKYYELSLSHRREFQEDFDYSGSI